MTRIDTLVALAGQAPPNRQRQASAGPWYRISNADGERAAVYVYDYIGGWDGVTAKDFIRELAGVTAPNIDLHINSGGGDVFDAIAMHAALRNHPAEVTSLVDGIAASAASFLAMAGNDIAIEKPAKMMIHDASGLTIGTEADHRQMADVLGEISNTIAGLYADRAGGTVAEWRDRMLAETWFSSSQAVDAGLADRVLGDTSTTNATSTTTVANTIDRRSQLIRARARVRETLKG